MHIISILTLDLPILSFNGLNHISILWSPSIIDDNVFLLKRKKPCAEEDQSEKRVHNLQPTNLDLNFFFLMHINVCNNRSVDGCRILLATQIVRTCMCVDITRVLSVGGILPSMGAAGDRPECYIKPPIGAALRIFSS